MSLLRANFVSLRGPVKKLAVLHFLDSVGAGIFMSGSTVYFIVVAGLPAAKVGLGLSLAGLAGFCASALMGVAADRVGAKRLLLLALPVLAFLYCLYPFVTSTAQFFCVVALVGALEWGTAPLFHTLIAELVDEPDRVPARAALRSLFNVGFSIGALVSAGLIGLGKGAMQGLPLANALSFALASVLVFSVPGSTPVVDFSARPSRFKALRDLPFLGVIASSSLLALHGSVLMVGIPLWLVTASRLPRQLIPVIFVVNTVLVVLFQVRCARGSETLRGGVGAGKKAGLAGAAACLVLAFSEKVPAGAQAILVVAAVLLVTLAELWQSASAFGLSYALAPERTRSEYLGAFHLHVVLQATVGPALVSLLVVREGALGWLGLGVLLLVGAGLIQPVAARAQRGASELAAAGVARGSS